MLISRTKDRGEAVKVSAVSRLCLSSPVPLDPLPPYIPGREKCLKEHKRKQERQHMGMKEEERDDMGFTWARATSSCLHFLLFPRLPCLANPTPFLTMLFPKDTKVVEFVTSLTREWKGGERGESQSHWQVRIRSECFPSKSELPWEFKLSSPENTGIYYMVVRNHRHRRS